MSKSPKKGQEAKSEKNTRVSQAKEFDWDQTELNQYVEVARINKSIDLEKEAQALDEKSIMASVG